MKRLMTVLLVILLGPVSLSYAAEPAGDCQERLAGDRAEVSERRFQSLLEKVRQTIDGRIKRGELNEAQFERYLDYLSQRQVLPATGVALISWFWTFARDHYHWHDVLSLHQSNLLRGAPPALIFDYFWRHYRRDESSRPILYMMALLTAANLIEETPLVGMKFDPGDLTAGMLGVFVTYAVYRYTEYKFITSHLTRGAAGESSQ